MKVDLIHQHIASGSDPTEALIPQRFSRGKGKIDVSPTTSSVTFYLVEFVFLLIKNYFKLMLWNSECDKEKLLLHQIKRILTNLELTL